MVFTAFAFEDEIAEVFTKTEWKKCKQEYVLLDGRYLLFEGNLQDKTLFIFWKRAEKIEIGQSFEESIRGSRHVENLEIFWKNNTM